MSWVINAYCYQTQLGLTSKYNPQTINLPATGACGALNSTNCPATYTWNKITPSTIGASTTYNQLNFQAMNGIINVGTLPLCTTVKGATSTYQCLSQACQSSDNCVYCARQKVCVSGCSSPIVLDVSGEGFLLTSAKDGVQFDMSGDGPVQMAWTARGAGNAFLSLPGADGLVHNGKELFGNYTPQPPSNHPNGFLALAVYDDPKNGGNGDGIIDARDAIFSSLRLWIDANHDGISQLEELHTLPSLGINSISLAYKASEKTDQYGNVFRYRAQLNPDNPTDAGKTVYDIFFVQAPATMTAAEGKTCPVPSAKSPSGGVGFTVKSVRP